MKVEEIGDQKFEITMIEEQLKNLRLLFDELNTKFLEATGTAAPSGAHKKKMVMGGDESDPDGDNPNVYIVKSALIKVFKPKSQNLSRRNMGFFPCEDKLRNIAQNQLRQRMLRMIKYSANSGLYSVTFCFPNKVEAPEVGYKDYPKQEYKLDNKDELGSLTFGMYRWPDGGLELTSIEGYSKWTNHRQFRLAGKQPTMEKTQLKLN